MLYFGKYYDDDATKKKTNTLNFFRHCDQVHAVEPKNDSQVDSSVLYIPSVPLCRINSEYILIQREAFEKGL